MKKIFLILHILLLSLIKAQMVAIGIQGLRVDYVDQPVTTPIKLGNKSSVNVIFNVTMVKSAAYSIGNGKLYIKLYNSQSGVLSNLIAPIDVPASTFQTSAIAPIKVDVFAKDLGFGSDNYISATLLALDSGAIWSSPGIPIVKSPTFTLNPPTISIPCNSVASINFTVDSNTTIGTFNKYIWAIGDGWNYSGQPAAKQIITTGNSIDLAPSSPTILPQSVSVTPVWNNTSQDVLTSSIKRQAFDDNIQINGDSVICTIPSTTSYSTSILNAESVTWSSSDPTVGSVITSQGAQTIINVLKSGKFTLTAIVKNSCDQTRTVTKDIFVGTPKYHIAPDPSNSNYVRFYMVSDIPNTSLEDQGFTPDNIIWKRIDTGTTKTGFSYFYPGPANYNWSFDVEVTATNNCGVYKSYVTVSPPPPPLCANFKIAHEINSVGSYIVVDPCSNSVTTNDFALKTTDPKLKGIHITIVNSQGIIVLETTSLRFNLLNQLPGTYYATILKDSKVVHRQTIIKE